MPPKISNSERARRREIQLKKIAMMRQGFTLGTVFGIGFIIKSIIEEQRRERANDAALQWARFERYHRRGNQRGVGPPAANQPFYRFSAPLDDPSGDTQRAAIQQHLNANNEAEAKFVAEQKLPPVSLRDLPECYGIDPISQEEINLKDDPDAVAIIYERGNPLKAHCYDRNNFSFWWADGNSYYSTIYAYDFTARTAVFQIFRLYNDQTYVTANSKNLLTSNNNKVYQRVFFKNVQTHQGTVKLYVLVPVPLVP